MGHCFPKNMSTIRIAIIVLNYRGEQILARCLSSILPGLQKEDALLVVDNGREGLLMRDISIRFPEVEVIAAHENLGFSRGMNLGIRHMQEKGNFDAFWLLNNDATILPDTLEQLKAALRSNGSRALYSPVIYHDPKKRPWFAGGRIDFFRMRAEHQRVVFREDAYETGFLTGCALFIPREVIASIGLLDERYFLYYEDVEYSLRAFRRSLKLLVVPTARAYHSEVSRENPAKTYWLVRSGAEFFLREARGWWRAWVRVYFFLRRLKNWLETIYAPRSLAREVKRAYTDVSL